MIFIIRKSANYYTVFYQCHVAIAVPFIMTPTIREQKSINSGLSTAGNLFPSVQSLIKEKTNTYFQKLTTNKNEYEIYGQNFCDC